MTSPTKKHKDWYLTHVDQGVYSPNEPTHQPIHLQDVSQAYTFNDETNLITPFTGTRAVYAEGALRTSTDDHTEERYVSSGSTASTLRAKEFHAFQDLQCPEWTQILTTAEQKQMSETIYEKEARRASQEGTPLYAAPSRGEDMANKCYTCKIHTEHVCQACTMQDTKKRTFVHFMFAEGTQPSLATVAV